MFGDIGTSPLYALKSCFTISGLRVTELNVLGIISLFVWTLICIVWIKYSFLVMRVDNHGEGGILALTTLAQKLKIFSNKSIGIIASILGTALFLGDGIITPAISVLSAIEGLECITSSFKPYTIPLSVMILTLLFGIQKRGSGSIGRFFGPIMLVWFLFISVTGVAGIVKNPIILHALNPYAAIHFMYHNTFLGFMTLGGVVLVVTGAEALYADMGHFGRFPIQLSWGAIVFVALTLNYLGQGASLLGNSAALDNPFFALVPKGLLIPSVILATVASVIASQAIISGVFSIVSQAILLNYLPRMHIAHTSNYQIGQIYIGSINFLLFVLTVLAVALFGSSDNLAQAYGLSVSGVMLLTSFLITAVAYKQWQWPYGKLFMIFLPMILLDFIFVATNLMKLIEGAWYTLLVTGIIYSIIRVWIKGNKALESQKSAPDITLADYLSAYKKQYKVRIPGDAIFLSRFSNRVPNSLLIHLHHNKFLHKKVFFTTFTIEERPFVPPKERFDIQKINKDGFSIEAKFGFKESPNLNRIIRLLKEEGMIENCDEVSIFLSKGIPVSKRSSKLKGFSGRIYIVLASIAQNASDFYKIPNDKVIELGVRYKV